jgi:hypothetical protein
MSSVNRHGVDSPGIVAPGECEATGRAAEFEGAYQGDLTEFAVTFAAWLRITYCAIGMSWLRGGGAQ